MFSLNLLNLIKNKTIPITYKTASLNILYKNKYSANNLYKNISEIIQLLNNLSFIYLYIQKYSSLEQKFLLSTNFSQHQYMHILKVIATLTSNFYISNELYAGKFSNWFILKKKLIIYKWLKYFFLSNLDVTYTYKNTFYINHILYLLYLKLKLNYHSLKNLCGLPHTLIFLTLENNKYLEEILKLKKNLIIITNTPFNKLLLYPNVITIININKNFIILDFILKIITTAIFHGILYT